MNNKKPTPIEQKRVVVYIPDEDHKKLRSKLALKGESVSSWVREQIQEYLNSN